MFKVLILQASHSLSDERTEFLIKDRLSFMRFLGLGLADPVPDANTIWTFREALTRATLGGRPAIEVLFGAYEAALTRAGFLAMGGQIVDASIIAAPKQRNTNAEKRDIKEGRIPAWADKPAKLAQKDRDARWTVKWSKAKPAEDGSPRMDLAVPAFGYKNHVGIDHRHGLIRTWSVTDAARHDGTQLPTLISKANTGSDVWGDTAYRSRANERLLAENGRRSQIHRKKPPRKPMPKHTARANGARSKVRAAVEHVFAHEKGPMGLVVRTIGSRLSITPIAGSQATDLASAEPNQPHPPVTTRFLEVSALLSTITTCAFRWEIAAGRSLTSRLRLSDRVPGGSDARVRAQLDEVANRPTPLALPHAIAVQPVIPASSKDDLAPEPGGLLSAASDALSEAAASGANLAGDALGAAARFLKSRKGRFP